MSSIALYQYGYFYSPYAFMYSSAWLLLCRLHLQNEARKTIAMLLSLVNNEGAP